MNKKFTVYSVLVILALVLSACSTASASTATSIASSSTNRQLPQGTLPAGFNPPQGTPPAGFNRSQGAAATATATAVPTLKPTATATATALSLTALAEASAKAYFDALSKKDFSAASQLVSIFSLTFAEMTRSDAASQLGAQSLKGTTWSDFQVVGSQVFNDSVILVHVNYRTGAAAASTSASQDANLKDEYWPFRLENGQWMYSWNNLIDYKTVDVDAQTQYHITVKPSMLVRYSDRLELHFLMQNQTSDTVYFVQLNDSLAVFHFGDQASEADKSSKVVISGLRTSFDEVIVVKGLFTSYPSYVEIRKAKGYVPNPWYTFQF